MNLNPSICGLGAECDASEGALRGFASCARVGIDCVVDTDAARFDVDSRRRSFGMNTTVHLHDILLFRRLFRALCLVREPLVFDLTR